MIEASFLLACLLYAFLKDDRELQSLKWREAFLLANSLWMDGNQQAVSLVIFILSFKHLVNQQLKILPLLYSG